MAELIKNSFNIPKFTNHFITIFLLSTCSIAYFVRSVFRRIVITCGQFHKDTCGNLAFVLEDDDKAVKSEIKLGRKSGNCRILGMAEVLIFE